MKKEPSKEEYQQIVKNLTPKHNSLLNCTKAFVTGGTFCVLGEVMKQLMMKYLNLSKKDSLLYVTIELILLSVLLTGFNFYGKITKFGGGGGGWAGSGRLRDSQIQWLQLQSNIRKKDRFLVLALRFLRSQDQ